MFLKYKNKQVLNKRMCGVKTYATLDKENVLLENKTTQREYQK
jgi:hypothetical protein